MSFGPLLKLIWSDFIILDYISILIFIFIQLYFTFHILLYIFYIILE